MRRHSRHVPGAMLLLFFLLFPLFGAPAVQWDKEIQAFEAQDRQTPPQPGQVLFLGSSSIRLWDLQKYFPGLDATNRGFGGSEIADSLEYAERIVLPYKPRMIVFYAGDNDIAAGKSPQQVFKDFEAFDAKIHETLPRTRIIFISIKPSLARWNLVVKMREANLLIRRYAEYRKHVTYLDVDSPMLDPDGKPRPELFRDDGLHLNDAGYRLWTRLVEETFARLRIVPVK